jgi:hypothetical protein
MRFAALLAFAAIALAGELEIRGTVVDTTTNQPIHRARVALSFWKEAGFIHRRALTIFTGENGGFSFTAVPAEGEFELQAFKTGYIGDARVPSIRVASGDRKKEFTLRLTPTGELMVMMRDDRGLPLGGAQVRIERKPDADGNFGPFLETADTAGRCTFVVPAGVYRITFAGPGSATLLRARGLTLEAISNPEWFEVAAGKSVQKELRVRPIPARTVHLRLETPGGAGQFLLLPAVGQPDDYTIQWGLTPFDRGARAVEITGLAPGAYRLVMGNYEKMFQIGDGDLNLAITTADRKY